ncbi:PRC-barrel domain-containing protein [Limimonas halophila]|uniref:PRC-barrel domain-containing protein n=1 Tax=Limimonas halophila TaxID=1082479 RepID=A0A1G7LHZ3_9PROT|nr:PRC-barrel domain-containing protein [Limimonas halophila]SDF49182.1 PRC-barrel domain-containing protein [Limimonas halophila]
MPHSSRAVTACRLFAGIAACAGLLISAPVPPVDGQTARATAEPQPPAVHMPAAPGIGFLASGAASSMSATTLIGADVVGSAGRSLGTVADVIFQSNGRPESLVVATGGFLGIGEKHAVVPWTPERMRMQGPYLVTNLARAHLRAAPDAERP